MKTDAFIIDPDDLVLVTGAAGFMGPSLIQCLLGYGFKRIRALTRPSSNVVRLEATIKKHAGGGHVEVVQGNLLSREDCARVAQGAAVVFHLATGGDKSYPDAFMNSVVTTRNLLDACLREPSLRRFVNVSSFAVYANAESGPLNETSRVSAEGGDAYTFAKVKQDELVVDYGERFGLPYVLVRPGSVFGPGKTAITGRVGIDTFGVFMHMGGSNLIPLTYIDNCSDAIVLAGMTPGVEKEVFNIVDDDLPTSREFLRQYKRNVQRFRSIYVPRPLGYAMCRAWEKYARWSHDQIPPVFNRRRWNAEWRKTRYSNAKLKSMLGWTPRVPMREGLSRYFAGCREEQRA